MNGGMEYPPAFRHSESVLSRIGVSVGRRLSDLVNFILPGKKLAGVLIVANRRTRLALPRGFKGQAIELSENGVDLSIWLAPEKMREHTSLSTKAAHFVFVGRLVDWKCLDVVLEALRQVPDAHLEVIGDGSMREPWEKLAGELGVATRVAFSGWLTQADCASRMQSAIALVLPSIYECGGAAVLEAMAAGVAVIATKWGGPVDYVESDTGILIEPESRRILVEGFAAAMRQVIDAPEIALKMGQFGRERVVRYFDWEQKIDSMMQIYRLAISNSLYGGNQNLDS
jgi:glycosyltransferase involved in cell wall biosynthesis